MEKKDAGRFCPGKYISENVTSNSFLSLPTFFGNSFQNRFFCLCEGKETLIT